MSEILDESRDEKLYQQLTENECGKKVYITSLDPIGLYNHTIKQFNAACNRTCEGSYEKIDPNCLYGVWMLRWWSLLRCDTNVFFLIVSFVINFVVSLIPILNLVDFVIWIIVWLLYERAYKVHKRTNQSLSQDPFKYMVHNNVLCAKANLYNLYYELPVSALSSLGMRESQIEILKSRKKGSTVTFMIYNDRFKSAWSRFSFLRIFHIIQLLICLGGVLLANLAIYPKMHINEVFQST